MPSAPMFSPLADRGLIEVSGPDRATFLQGLVSNDVTQVAPGTAVWAALLSPQGKWVSDFLILDGGALAPDALLLDAPRADAAMVAERLSRFRLRSKVALRDRSDEIGVAASWGEGASGDLRDPRHPDLGWRSYGPRAEGSADDYDAHRLLLGIPDGARDLDRDKTVLLEAGFDELHCISWTKGCYMGQELTARTRYRGLLKRRLIPVEVDGPLPPRDAPVTLDGREVGEMRSGRGARGLALLRLEAAGAPGLACGDALLRPRVPDWMRLPEAA